MCHEAIQVVFDLAGLSSLHPTMSGGVEDIHS